MFFFFTWRTNLKKVTRNFKAKNGFWSSTFSQWCRWRIDLYVFIIITHTDRSSLLYSGSICGGVLEDPLQAPTCEHAFCGVEINHFFFYPFARLLWLRHVSMNGLDVYKHVPLIEYQLNLINWNLYHEFWRIYSVGRRRSFRDSHERFVSLIDRLNISCENEGCTTIVKLDALANHLTECDFNPKKLIECGKGCGILISKENITVNPPIDCPLQIFLLWN